MSTLGSNGIDRKVYNLLKKKARAAAGECYSVIHNPNDLLHDDSQIADLVGVTYQAVHNWWSRCDTNFPVSSGCGLSKALSIVNSTKDIDKELSDRDSFWLKWVRDGGFFTSETEQQLLNIQAKISVILGKKIQERKEREERERLEQEELARKAKEEQERKEKEEQKKKLFAQEMINKIAADAGLTVSFA